MILAAADCAKSDTAPPPELSDYFIGDLLGSLPYSGGWKDQPMKWSKRVSHYWNVYSAYKTHSEARERMKGKDFMKWARQNKKILDTINQVEAMRGEYNSDYN